MVEDLLRFVELTWLVGHFCNYLLPKQDDGTFQIQVNQTQSVTTCLTLYRGTIQNGNNLLLTRI